MSSVRNFGIAFLVALLIFGGLAYLAIGYAQGLFDESIQNQQNANNSDIKDFEGNISDNTAEPIKVGRSFNLVVIGTDYDPVVYNDYLPSEDPGLHVARKVRATTILFVRFDKENRALIMSSIPAETKVTIDFVNMTLGEAYAYRGAEFIKDSVGNYTGLSVDYMIEFSGREFAEFVYQSMRGTSSYTCPIDLLTDNSKGLSPKSFSKDQQVSSKDDLYALLHYDGYTLETVSNRYRLVQSIFTQTLKKLISPDGNAYYNKLKPLNNDMVASVDTAQLLELVNTLTLYLEDTDAPTAVKTVNVYMMGDYAGGIFTPDTDRIRQAFSSYESK